MELPNNFAHYMLQDDDEYRFLVENSINRLEEIFGKIKHKFAKGPISTQILSKMKHIEA